MSERGLYDWLVAVQDRDDLSLLQKSVLLAVIRRIDWPSGTGCRASHASLARLSGASRSGVQVALRALRKRGIVRRVHKSPGGLDTSVLDLDYTLLAAKTHPPRARVTRASGARDPHTMCAGGSHGVRGTRARGEHKPVLDPTLDPALEHARTEDRIGENGPEIPEGPGTDLFRATWERWLEHVRLKTGKALSHNARTKQLRRLGELSIDEAVEILRRQILAGTPRLPPRMGSALAGAGERQLFEAGAPKTNGQRAREPIWDTLAQLFHPSGVPTSMRAALGAVVRDLRALGATPDSIKARHAAIPADWGVVTPQCLVKHWDTLANPPKQVRRPGRIEAPPGKYDHIDNPEGS